MTYIENGAVHRLTESIRFRFAPPELPSRRYGNFLYSRNVQLYNKVRENASIDWTIKDSVKSKLKVVVKKLLRKYGYPPDMQKLATETVLRQAEMIARELVEAR